MCPWPELGLAGAVNPKSVAFRILAALFNVLVTCTPSSQLPSRHDQPAHLQGQLEHARLLTVLEWVTVELSIIPGVSYDAGVLSCFQRYVYSLIVFYLAIVRYICYFSKPLSSPASDTSRSSITAHANRRLFTQAPVSLNLTQIADS